MIWLIEEQAGRTLTMAHRDIRAQAAPGLSFSTASKSPARRAGATLEIVVEGVLTEKPDVIASLFGGGNTTYESIVRALGAASSDRAVRDVVLRVNSPGGTVDGLFEALAAIESFKASGKPLRVVAAKAQSAAYALAAAAGKITAATPAAFFGSIGTALDFVRYADERTVSITNTASPDKRPNVETPEGRAVYVKLLDDVNELFVDAIARGRNISARDVKTSFGRGASFVANEAKRRGMIDVVPRLFGGPRVGAAASSARTLGFEMDFGADAAPVADVGDAIVAELRRRSAIR